jgi:anthranilate synthase/indole-3-glycerol phosphate synthase/phosphoribosylanthranilate isomerase
MDAVAKDEVLPAAAGISVLTEPTWFKGTLADLAGVRGAVEALGDARPAVLRKDFIIDEYQVLEARVAGADSVLLIVASLDDSTLAQLLDFSRELGMEPLVEVNNAEEMRRALDSGATVIGINNRDLRDFNVDLGTTDRLAGWWWRRCPRAQWIGTRADVSASKRRRRSVLVGESLMLADDPAAKIGDSAAFTSLLLRFGDAGDEPLCCSRCTGTGKRKSTVALTLSRTLPQFSIKRCNIGAHRDTHVPFGRPARRPKVMSRRQPGF